MNDTVQSFYDQSSEVRYQLTLAAIRRNQTLWTLKDDQGCIMVSSDEEQCLPIWPDEATATAWATEEHAHCEPLAIELDAFLERWVSGMSEDGYFVAVGPSLDAESLVEHPQDLADAITQTK
ncbi:DUF2750 domain-containing protein [Celerinatantimonas sp. MCCC 1A17872]|uniref:DUF2750 domain-containing protein n=1 Tax=Celerinatantimonas sp. MCCC 1A17872 TaxID=3177514 RepID=UPI0038C7B2E0